MMRPDLTATRRVANTANAFLRRSRKDQRANFGSLIIDGQGVVVSCSVSGGRMFGGDFDDIEGSEIRSLLTDIAPSETSSGFNSRYMGFLSRDPDWKRFQAVDIYGQRFPVEIVLSKMKVEDEDMFLLNLRHAVE